MSARRSELRELNARVKACLDAGQPQGLAELVDQEQALDWRADAFLRRVVVCCEQPMLQVLHERGAPWARSLDANGRNLVFSARPNNLAFLLMQGCELELHDRFGLTPLLSACDRLASDMSHEEGMGCLRLRALLEAGARAEAATPEGRTTVMAAVRSNTIPVRAREALELLVHAGAKLHARDHDGKDALDYLPNSRYDVDVARHLVDMGMSLHGKHALIERLAYRSTTSDDARFLQRLVDELGWKPGSAPHDAQARHFDLALLALQHDHPASLMVLLEAGATLGGRDSNGRGADHWLALRPRCADVLRALQARRAATLALDDSPTLISGVMP